MAAAVSDDIIAVIVPDQCERRKGIHFSVVLQFFFIVGCVVIVLESNSFFNRMA